MRLGAGCEALDSSVGTAEQRIIGWLVVVSIAETRKRERSFSVEPEHATTELLLLPPLVFARSLTKGG